MDLLSRRTEHGTLFETDARLRPDGEKGLMVNTLDAFEDYYRKRAQLWEIQALSRMRTIAGDFALGEEFQALVGALANFVPEHVAAGFPVSRTNSTQVKSKKKAPATAKNVTRKGLAAYSEDWKEMIVHMRGRIEKERTPADRESLAIKTGRGGLIDAEFAAQAMCLEHGWLEANTLNVLERIRDEGVMERTKADDLIRNYRELRRVEGILRRWSLAGETELPRDAAAFRRVAIRCGFRNAAEFHSALAYWRDGLRRAFKDVFGMSDQATTEGSD
jgi:glutamate-ammonia-ligase adenylyltransferase